MKSKWKYLQSSLLWNIPVLIGSLGLLDIFILKDDRFAILIAAVIYIITSLYETRFDIVADKIKDLEERVAKLERTKKFFDDNTIF